MTAIGAVLALVVERTRTRRATRELERRAATIANLTGDVTSLRSMLQEYIQQRESAEEVLRRGEERYRALVDNLTTIVFQVDRDLRWTYEGPNSAHKTKVAMAIKMTIGTNQPATMSANL